MADLSGLAALFGGLMQGYGGVKVAQQAQKAKSDQAAVQAIFTSGLKDPSVFQSEQVQKMLDTHFGQKGLTATMGEQISAAHKAGHSADLAAVGEMINNLQGGGAAGGESPSQPTQPQGQPQQAVQTPSVQPEAIPTRFQTAQPGAATGAPAGAALAPAPPRQPMAATNQLTGAQAPPAQTPGEVQPHPSQPGTYVGSKYHWSVQINMKDPAASKVTVSALTPAERKDRAFQALRSDLKKTGSVDKSLDNIAAQGLTMSPQDSAAFRKEAASGAFAEGMKRTGDPGQATIAAIEQGGPDFIQEHPGLMNYAPDYVKKQAEAKATEAGAVKGAEKPIAVQQESEIAGAKETRESLTAAPLPSLPTAQPGEPAPLPGNALLPKQIPQLNDIKTKFNSAITPLKTKLSDTVQAKEILKSGRTDAIAQMLAIFSTVKGHVSRTTTTEINAVLQANGLGQSIEQATTRIRGQGTITAKQYAALTKVLQVQENGINQEIAKETKNAVHEGRSNQIPEAHLAGALGDWYTKAYPTTAQGSKGGIGNLPAPATTAGMQPIPRHEAMSASWTRQHIDEALARGGVDQATHDQIVREQGL